MGMNKHVIFWSITVGLGGMLFGLDVAVISGAELAIQKLWHLDSWTHGLAVATALYGTVVGAALGGIPADKYGRKQTLLWIGISFFVSSIGAALATDVNLFMLFRFLGGLGIGASSVVAPIYISEIAPPQHRGKLVISFQLNVVLGILLAYISNYLLQGGDDDWRYMLGMVAIPSLLFSFLILFTPETPQFLLLKRNDQAGALKVLTLADPDPEGTLKRILDNAKTHIKKEHLFSKKFFTPLLLSFLFAFFNQMSGINAIIYYAPRIYELTGLGKESALLSTAGIGVANLLFTLLGWYFIDKIGRRILMYIGSVGYIISLGLIAFSFYQESYAFVPIYIFLFIASHAIGQGSVIWVFISEIFPNSVRASGMAWGSLTHWLLAALVANFFPILTENFGGTFIFSIFGIMMVGQFFYVMFLMPETKGASLEDIEKQIIIH
ncbi:sugar porter family MFS transporter [Aquirufa ecclesiirivi]|uniref:sugar porter family MFS transporter n=1 Tax=Aquirufa ecclesiirivi TaxID=2715124 RepID=UPI00140B57F9|nr:sugar porter family MFS transporter [Aquirufa ecclesiirivi]MCZ2472152.1 sugar porter family MFS transporter [Aquirufa ecclesiirivi]NHC48538.1 sugar porter family MFS transporter [Aquirufa ecclesiirivi]